MSIEYKSLRIEKHNGVTEVILTGPGKGNAMGPDFWREMPILFAELDLDAETRVVVIRGEGGNFSYGLDLMAMVGNIGVGASNQLAAERAKFLDKVGEMQQACNRVASCRKPVIAAVNGWCIGGGLDLIAACDIRLASADARFSLREAKIAIVADLGSLQRLPAIIGQGHTRELAFTGKDIDAARAHHIGLVNDVYETPDAMLEAARTLAAEIAANPPLVVQGVKQVMNYCADKSVADGLEYVAVWNSAFMHSLDLVEAITAFKERRKPEFKGQ
ncbi:MAG TPA: crotonase/enoyl-CoA hydratase family protein [Blastocatellia bacterium]|nr:crotonase/enoyl-CoA hydratase family protein [Blastocatellia bacterium]HMV82668.1 crotonase/enoyl-CoA hydratase family protein [Blastocatellia bacterium]HMY76294.1 crotonase/enoyl-CoA hydratase family protein [Blastocatellia bacterium]HMZ16815.1 crotonase/enoyl-CoA hydratase family protein [Blastocatellia bacterium]HNG32285.1 crotonase/enoyl-CoA hydratase family protein [Blastocatellia bacterium]